MLQLRIFWMLLFFIVSGTLNAQSETVKIGVLVPATAQINLSWWKQTTDQLSTLLPGRHFILLPLKHEQITAVTKNHDVQFVIASPAMYVELSREAGARAMATAQYQYFTHLRSPFHAATLVALRSGPENLSALRGKRITWAKNNQDAWLLAQYSLLQSGIDLIRHQADVLSVASSQAAVQAVLSGQADAAVLAAGELEGMVAQGIAGVNDLVVLNEQPPDQRLPLLHSTAVYPGWVFASLPETAEDTVKDVLAVLLAQSDQRVVNWVPAQDYQSVANMMQAMNVGPFQTRGAEPAAVAKQDLEIGYLVSVALLLLLVIGLMYVIKLQRRLASQQQRLRNVLQVPGLASLRKDFRGDREEWSESLYKLIGIEPTGRAAPADKFLQWVHPEDRTKFESQLAEALERQDDYQLEYRLLNNNGVEINVVEHGVVLRTSFGHVSEIQAVIRDMTQITKLEMAVHDAHARVNVILAAVGEAIFITDASGCIEFLNHEAERLCGWGLQEAKGMQYQQVVEFMDEKSHAPLDFVMLHCMTQGDEVCAAQSIIIRSRSGLEYHVHVSCSPIMDRQGNTLGIFLICQDVTQTRRMEQQMAYQASHDALTGLLNRRSFEARLQQAINAVLDNRHTYMLVYLDLDQFKVINDTVGHLVGDELLAQLATLLAAKVGKGDILARMGGDEFAVLLEDSNLAQARKLANSLLQTIAEFRFMHGQTIIETAVSIGLVPVNQDSGSLTEVLGAADAACYVAKELGRNRIHVYQVDDMVLAKRHGDMHWSRRVRQALREESFLLYAQPIQALQYEDHTIHVEILIRMLGDDGAIIAPGSFLQAAEQYHLMPNLDRWVIRSTLERLASDYAHLGEGDILCNINLSGQSFSDEHFLNDVIDLFDQTRVTPGKICFEITETAAIGNLREAMNFIGQLRAMGCKFALDDFGSGLSSFSYLKNLPVDYLKIDGSFVRTLLDDPLDAALVEAMHNVGRLMGIKTVAEFVETPEILEKVRAIGIDYAQGYAISQGEPF